MITNNDDSTDKVNPSNETDSEEEEEEEDDEDYVPPSAEGGDDDEKGDNGTVALAVTAGPLSLEANHASIPNLSSSKQKAVDDAFMELFGKPYRCQQDGSIKDKPNGSGGGSSCSSGGINQGALKKRKILSDIFGGTSIASKLMETCKDTIQNDEMSRKRKVPLLEVNRKAITEQIKFAETMEIQKSVVMVGNGDQTQPQQQESAANASNKASGIDAVLSQIKGPQKFTTIDKTNVDWENFKDKAGLEEELKKKAQGKDAYLVKKDFLNRVDVRRFEQEREERNKKRAAAALGNPNR
mmetsp:Transcript_7490/g.14214  ORF Transcript_7490/g.14214 Transcript_7490/m.14214 type:complete len:297 (-) Transcript_7490:109-999(-)|eukprot:CAMPEP_0176492492 /NCGR_PEP_ID=MMETSP0200_2-20121128/9032_1 /TAXON_ID=947934 /ORGANISM="Chaetoceros sp., Strain GSL56" /LENGTH=296 /DNA_ID=CAMNT_0017890067 /DNA_START=52 /DNA_END=942 /DNA_ORIENTATION=-